MRIFTPEVEVPFAGHPTVGAAIYLATTESVRGSAGVHGTEDGHANLLLEENVGPVPALVRYQGGRPVFARFITAVLPERRESPHSLERLAAMVGLEVGDLGASAPPPSPPPWCPAALPFTSSRCAPPPLGEGSDSTADVRVRMFAPGSGVPEDPATGSAAGVLGGYLGDASGRDDGTLRWRVAQGEEIGRPSLLEVECDRAGGKTAAIRVGGAATFVSRGTMTIPGPPILPPPGRRVSWLARYGSRLP